MTNFKHFTFYEFIVSKARGKSGPLFNFDVHDDVRMTHDATVEKNESHAGKIVERGWYNRNKHVFPSSRWETFDPVRVINFVECNMYASLTCCYFIKGKKLWIVSHWRAHKRKVKAGSPLASNLCVCLESAGAVLAYSSPGLSSSQAPLVLVVVRIRFVAIIAMCLRD